MTTLDRLPVEDTVTVWCDIYLRLSDPRVEGALDGREEKLRAEARRLGGGSTG